MRMAIFFLGALLAYVSVYIVSRYALAVNIHPDALERLRPQLSERRRRLLEQLADDPRLLTQIALFYKSAVLALLSGGGVFALEGLQLRTGITPWVVFPVGLGLVWMLYVAAAELLPRRASRRSLTERTGGWWLIGPLFRLLRPLVLAYRRAIRTGREETPITEEEKGELIERAIDTIADQAGIDEVLMERDEREMIGQILRLDQTVVREIMVPRIDITAIERNASLEEIRRLVQEDGHSRYPVYEETIDNVLGVLYVKDLFSRLGESEEPFDVTAYLRQPMVVPESKVISDLLREFRSYRVHLALVIDEFGGLSGLVTLEDILEEIVGEIQDEHDAEEPELTVLPDGSYRVDAALLVEELQERLGTDYEQGDYDTVGGLIYDLVGSVPEQGARVDWHDLEFEVERVDGQRIEQVRVRRRPAGG